MCYGAKHYCLKINSVLNISTISSHAKYTSRVFVWGQKVIGNWGDAADDCWGTKLEGKESGAWSLPTSPLIPFVSKLEDRWINGLKWLKTIINFELR